MSGNKDYTWTDVWSRTAISPWPRKKKKNQVDFLFKIINTLLLKPTQTLTVQHSVENTYWISE